MPTTATVPATDSKHNKEETAKKGKRKRDSKGKAEVVIKSQFIIYNYNVIYFRCIIYIYAALVNYSNLTSTFYFSCIAQPSANKKGKTAKDDKAEERPAGQDGQPRKPALVTGGELRDYQLEVSMHLT